MFTKNSTLRCIDGVRHHLTVGKEYTVTRCDSEYVHVKNDHGHETGWYHSRFQPVTKVSEVKTPTPVALLSPQNQVIVKHLMRAGSITQREALMDHSVQSLTKRVSELVTKHHYPIKTNPKLHPVTGQRYARYEMQAA